MHSTLNEPETDPHDVFVIDPEVVLAARADPVAPHPAPPVSPPAAPPIAVAPAPVAAAAVASGPKIAGPSISGPRMAGSGIAGPSGPMLSGLSAGAPMPRVDTNFRATEFRATDTPYRVADVNDIRIPRRPQPKSRWAARTSYGFLFALCSTIAVALWDQYGNAAQAMIGRWIPSLSQISLSQISSSSVAPQPADTNADGPAAQAAAADQAPAQPASTQPAPDAAANSAAAVTGSTADAPTPPSMAHDMAMMGQQIEALKATVEQLRAGQEQLAQQLARNVARPAVAPTPHPKVSALTPRPPVAAPHKPRPAFSPEMAAAAIAAPRTAASLPPSQAAAPQAAPMQYQSRSQTIDRSDGDPVDRPPMPLR